MGDGSSWLTAFVVKAFSEASKFISINAQLVQESVNWLFSNQMENGCFRKRGYVHSSYLKGGGSDDSLTVFIRWRMAASGRGDTSTPATSREAAQTTRSRPSSDGEWLLQEEGIRPLQLPQGRRLRRLAHGLH